MRTARSLPPAAVLALAAAMALPTAASAHVIAGTDSGADRLAQANFARHADPFVARMAVAANVNLADRPPTDRPVTDRPVTDRPTDAPRPHDAERQVFEVGDIGTVTLAVNNNGMWLARVDHAPGWQVRAARADRPRHEIPVVFSNLESCQRVTWTAVFVEGEVRTSIARHPIEDCDRFEIQRFEVGEIAVVALAVGSESLRVHEVKTAEGWVAARADASSDRRAQVAVNFFNRSECTKVAWTARLVDGEVVTHAERSHRDDCGDRPADRPADRPSDRPAPDGPSSDTAPDNSGEDREQDRERGTAGTDQGDGASRDAVRA